MIERCLNCSFILSKSESSNIGLYIYAGCLVHVLQRQYHGHMTIEKSSASVLPNTKGVITFSGGYHTRWLNLEAYTVFHIIGLDF